MKTELKFFHVSKEIHMIPNPLDPLLPMIPVASPGNTYNKGKNKAKREKRAKFGGRKHAKRKGKKENVA